MSTDHSPLTPEQARERLSAGRNRSLGSTRDRRVHAIGTAVFGLAMGLFMTARHMTSGTAEVVLTILFGALLIGEVIWVERTARTVPRRAGLWSRLGAGASLLLALGGVLPWLNLRAQSGPNSWPLVLAAAAVVAVPSLVAAAVIARGRK